MCDEACLELLLLPHYRRVASHCTYSHREHLNSRNLMPPRSAASAWPDPDINALINFLVSQLPTVADGTGFKPTVWNEAAVVVNALNKGRGGEKTSSSCKSKFARV